MAFKIAVGNFKGGVGKSTIAFSLSYAFSVLLQQDLKVLLCDFDSQCDSSKWWGMDDSDIEQSNLYNLLKSGTNIDKCVFKIDNLDILSSSEFDHINSLFKQKGNNFLKDVLSEFEHCYDIIIFDISPTRNSINSNVLYAADTIVAVTSPEFLSVRALQELYKFQNQQLGIDKIDNIVINKFKSNTREHKDIQTMLKEVFWDKNIFTLKDKIGMATSSRTLKTLWDLKDKEIQQNFNLLLKSLITKYAQLNSN